MIFNNFLSELDRLCRKMDSKYDINLGGCCFVAYVLASNFEYYDIPFKIIVYLEEGDDIYFGGHYAIKVNDYIINDADYSEDNNFQMEEVESDQLDLYETYYNHYWNPRYSKRWNLIVQTMLNSKFKRYYENNRT